MRYFLAEFCGIVSCYPLLIKTLILVCGMDILLQCKETEGLEMSLDRTKPRSTDAKVACFLDCEENLELSTSSRVNISRLSIFKKIPHAYSDNDSSEKGNMIASLSRDEPSLSRVSDDTKVDGLLEARRSTLHIDMFKQTDCLAAYTCEVQTIDSNGNIRIGVNRLRQQQIQNENQDQTGALTSSVSIQLLSISHQLDTKLALLSQSFGHLQDKLDSIERRIDGRMWSIEQKINNLEPSLGNKVEALERGLNSLKDQMRSHDYSPVVDKLCQLEEKVCKSDSKTEDGKEDKQDSYTQDPPAPGKLESQLENVNNVLQSLSKDLSQMHLLEKQHHDSLQTLVTEMSEVFKSCEDLGQTVMNTSSFSLQDRSTELFSLIEERFSETFASRLQSTMADLLLPKTCKKGMSPVLSYSSYPYAVVLPDKDKSEGLDEPYLCDTVTDGGGWIIIQRRSSGDVDFYRSWSTYKEGFGSIAGDFWIGNEILHKLTSKGAYELRVELKYKRKSVYANYDKFSLGNEQSKYTLRIGKYSGTAGDSLEVHNGEPFSTYDRDHDLNNRNCAKVYNGAWWYKACHHSNLNGRWKASAYKGPSWQALSNGDPVSYSEMKIRRKDI